MLQIIRSWTRQPLSVAIELYQSPVVLYDQSDESSASASAGCVNHIGASLTVRSEGNVQIGGITLVRQVLLRRKKPKTKEWTDWVEIQRGEHNVVGECRVGTRERYVC